MQPKSDCDVYEIPTVPICHLSFWTIFFYYAKTSDNFREYTALLEPYFLKPLRCPWTCFNSVDASAGMSGSEFLNFLLYHPDVFSSKLLKYYTFLPLPEGLTLVKGTSKMLETIYLIELRTTKQKPCQKEICNVQDGLPPSAMMLGQDESGLCYRVRVPLQAMESGPPCVGLMPGHPHPDSS